ncbi:MAG TPA: hypothetical protein VGQ27_12420 [Steroidobacteraceae bacterium]|nr:hypothetical protein [Steroidobacteraceae bacterium]
MRSFRKPHARALQIILILLVATMAGAADESAVYGRDPHSLANRLYLAVATRKLDGVRYGVDIAEPFFEPIDDVAGAAATLDEFLLVPDKQLRLTVLEKALLQNDLWAAFDAEEYHEGSVLRVRLALAIWKLRLTKAEIATLPDNFAHAAGDQTASPPAELLDSNGSWVQVGESGLGPVAPFHVQMVSGRSAFQVFISCPGGRAATLAYLDKLNMYLTPYSLEPAQLSSYSSTGHTVRMLARSLNPDTPQFPVGTRFALVRRMLVIDAHLQPAITPLTQKVQMREYRQLPSSQPHDLAAFLATQSVFEWVMRRTDLLGTRPAGLLAVQATDREFQRTEGRGKADQESLAGPVVLSTCPRCHAGIGIFTVNSYTGFISKSIHDAPQLPAATNDDYQFTSTIDWKKQQYDWGLLRGILETEAGRSH